jgi:GNAT superfamily N-acetyltransferase
MSLSLTPCVTDEDYVGWREVFRAVEPEARCASVAELKQRERHGRMLWLARSRGEIVGSSMVTPSDLAGRGYINVWVLPSARRQRFGSEILSAALAQLRAFGHGRARCYVSDEGALAFASRWGFAEVDREVEQVRSLRDLPEPGALPAGVEVVVASDRPGLWEAAYERFGREVLADFAVYTPLEVSPERWAGEWTSAPTFLAVAEGEVIACAGVDIDPDDPVRGECGLTAVRRDWRGRGLATQLKRVAMEWAAAEGLRELVTWTQANNTPMIGLNEKLGFRPGRVSIVVEESGETRNPTGQQET